MVAALLVGGAALGCSAGGGGAPTAGPTSAGETPAVPTEVRLTEDADGTQVRLAVGGTLVVALGSNPSTGYSWAVEEPSPAQLEQEGPPVFEAPEATEPVVGAPGTEVFTFTAVAAGTASLTLVYARPWEEDVPPEQTFTATVEVVP
jgi:inhibitor of cysteine peptidase